MSGSVSGGGSVRRSVGGSGIVSGSSSGSSSNDGNRSLACQHEWY